MRFSKNKIPYKTNFGIEITPGWKRSGMPSFYLHIEPGNYSFIGGGLYLPDRFITESIRQKILKDGKSLEKLYTKMSWYGFQNLKQHDLKTAPRGYSKDHKHINLIRQKDRIFSKELSDQDLSQKNILSHIKKEFQVLLPFNLWLLDAIEKVK